MLCQKPRIRLQVVLEQILRLVRAAHLEIIRSRPLRLALDLMPPIHHFLDLDPFPFPQESPRRLIRLLPRVTLNSDDRKLHGPILTHASCLPPFVFYFLLSSPPSALAPDATVVPARGLARRVSAWKTAFGNFSMTSVS